MAQRVSNKGRREAKRSHEGRSHQPDLRRIYKHNLSPLTQGDFDFDLTLIRGDKPAIRIDKVTESLDWTDESAVMTGSIQLRRPIPHDADSLPIGRGHRVRCRVWWASRWYELWQMRVGTPEVNLKDGTVSAELSDDLDQVRRHERNWSFRKTKRRKKGYFCHEIAKLVAKRIGAQLGEVAKGKHRMPKLVRPSTSALDVLREAYAFETEKTGRRFVIRMHNGKIDIVPFRRSTVLYELAGKLTDALIQPEGTAKPVTAITGTARIGKGKDSKKVKHTEFRRDVIRRFGYTHTERSYGRVSSRAVLRNRIRRDLARALRVRKTATLTMPGIPFIRRGDACELDLPEEGFRKKAAYVFVTRVGFHLAPSDFTMEMTVNADDPFLKYQEEREKDQRERKRRERKRRKKD